MLKKIGGDTSISLRSLWKKKIEWFVPPVSLIPSSRLHFFILFANVHFTKIQDMNLVLEQRLKKKFFN